MCSFIRYVSMTLLMASFKPLAAKDIQEVAPSLGSFIALSHKIQQVSLKDGNTHSRWLAEDGREGLSLSQQKVASVLSSMVEIEALSSLSGDSQWLLIVVLLCTPLAIVALVALVYSADSRHGQGMKGDSGYWGSPRADYADPNQQDAQAYGGVDRRQSNSSGSGVTRFTSPTFMGRGGYPVSRSQSSMSKTSREESRRSSSGRNRKDLSSGYPASVSVSTPTGSSRGPSSIAQDDHDVLYPQLVVHHPGGMKWRLNGVIEPRHQEELLEVCQYDYATNVEVRIFISESNRDCSILLESGMRSPIAFINTSDAFGGLGLGLSDQHVTIRRIGRGHGRGAAPYAVVSKEGSSVVVRKNGRSGSAVVQTVVDSGVEITVLGVGGQILAVADKHGTSTDITMMCGTDAALVLCSLIAGFKLGAC